MATLWNAVFIAIIVCFMCRQFDGFCEGFPQDAPDVYGHPPRYHSYFYSSSNYVYLPEPHDVIRASGRISKWSFYVTRPGLVSLQVWRMFLLNRYKLVDFETYLASHTGVHTWISRGLRVRRGDVIGFHTSSDSMIPFAGHYCRGAHSAVKKAYVSSTRRLQPGMFLPFHSMTYPSNLACRNYSLQVEVVRNQIFTNGVNLFPHGSNTMRSSGIYIPDVTDQLRHSGYLVRWQIYARQVGRIYLQIWRKRYRNRYELVSQTPYEVTRTGRHVILPANHTRLESGDVLGLTTSRKGIIPLRLTTCSGRLRYSLFHFGDSSSFSPLSPGIFVTFKVAAVCLEYAINLQLSKENETIVELGHSPIRRVYADARKGMVIIPEPLQPLRAGTVVGWRLYAVRSGRIHLHIWRPTEYYSHYKLVSLMKYDVTSPGVHNITMTSSRNTIEDGDLIGFFFPGKNILPFDGVACSDPHFLYRKTSTSSNLGSVFLFWKKTPIWNRCKRYSIAVIVLENITRKDSLNTTGVGMETAENVTLGLSTETSYTFDVTTREPRFAEDLENATYSWFN